MNKKTRTSPISKKRFKRLTRHPAFMSIDKEERLYNLAPGYWVYDELLSDLYQSGWLRIAAGFKAGVYAHPGKPFCIKLLGMGVGENPFYFCERGYYLEHERNMLVDFRNSGFDFAPAVLSQQESIEFLIKECTVRPNQAELRVLNNDLLIMEHIPGMPFATQTGRHLGYDDNLTLFDAEVLYEICTALEALRREVERANAKELLHNDPMPPNIILTLSASNQIRARLVDFELAQNLGKPSPDYVNNSVAELYRERDVPRNAHTGTYTKNLDQHLLDESINLARGISSHASELRHASGWETLSLSVGFIGGVSINLGKALELLKHLAR